MWRPTARCLALAGGAATICSTAALAGGFPGPGVLQGGDGVAGPGGVHYVAVPTATRTTVQRMRGGVVLGSRTFAGSWGIPVVSFDRRTEGVSHDGVHLLVGDVPNTQAPRTVSRFLVLSTRTLRVERRIVLRGDFSYDAVSPDFRTLFLVQHVSTQDALQYVVRAFDLRPGHLRPGVVADKRSDEWLMSGVPTTRATSRNGVWAFTLYGGGPHAFIHALDTRHAQAVCIDLPWRGLPASMWKLRLALDGRRLVVRRPGGRAAAVVDTASLRVLSVLPRP
jgi:hypothetical protein